MGNIKHYYAKINPDKGMEVTEVKGNFDYSTFSKARFTFEVVNPLYEDIMDNIMYGHNFWDLNPDSRIGSSICILTSNKPSELSKKNFILTSYDHNEHNFNTTTMSDLDIYGNAVFVRRDLHDYKHYIPLTSNDIKAIQKCFKKNFRSKVFDATKL